MPIHSHIQLSGFLLEWPGEMEASSVDLCKNITLDETAFGGKWNCYSFLSDRPFQHEAVLGPYKYPLYVRYSETNKRLILLSVNSKVVEYIRNSAFESTFINPPRPVLIAVDAFTRSLKEGENGNYSLSFIHSRIDTYGDQLRSVSFWGDDLLEAGLFRELLPRIHCITCGLRPHDANSTEIMRISADGGLSHIAGDTRGVRNALVALNHLDQHGYLGKANTQMP